METSVNFVKPPMKGEVSPQHSVNINNTTKIAVTEGLHRNLMLFARGGERTPPSRGLEALLQDYMASRATPPLSWEAWERIKTETLHYNFFS